MREGPVEAPERGEQGGGGGGGAELARAKR